MRSGSTRIVVGLLVVTSMLLAGTASASGGPIPHDSTSVISPPEGNNRTFSGPISSVEQGGIASIPLTLGEADEAALRFSAQNDLPYEVGLTISAADGYAGEPIELRINTYTARIKTELDKMARSDLVFSTNRSTVELSVTYQTKGATDSSDSTDGERTDEVTSASQRDTVLPAGTYVLSLGAAWNASHLSEPVLENRSSIAFLSVEEATGPEAFDLYSVPAGQSVIGSEALTAATLTPVDTIARGDTLVAIVEEFGHAGLIESLRRTESISDGDELGKPLWEYGSVSFGLSADDRSPGTPKIWNTSGHESANPPSNLNVTGLNLEAYDGDLIVELGYPTFVEEPNGLNATVSISTPNLRADEGGDGHHESIEFVAPSLTIGPDMDAVPNAADVTIKGTTTLAPGSVVDPRSYSPGYLLRNTQATVYVDEAGVKRWKTRHDLTEGPAGTTIEIDVRGPFDTASTREATLLNSTPESVDFHINSTKLVIGETTSARVIAAYTDRPDEIVTGDATLSSTNTSITSISANGTVYSHASGQAELTASFRNYTETVQLSIRETEPDDSLGTFPDVFVIAVATFVLGGFAVYLRSARA